MSNMTREAMPRDKKEPTKRTEFQLYVNWKATPKHANVIDFTEQRLIRLAKKIASPDTKIKLLELLEAYRQNKIAIAWQEGEPAWTVVNKG